MFKACSTIMNGEMVRNLGFKLNLQGKNIECLALKIIKIEIMACYPMKPPCFCILNNTYNKHSTQCFIGMPNTLNQSLGNNNTIMPNVQVVFSLLIQCII